MLHVIIGSSSSLVLHNGVCEKNNPLEKNTHWLEKNTLEYQPSEHQIGGWRAVSAAGLQGKGLRKRSVFSQTPVSAHFPIESHLSVVFTKGLSLVQWICTRIVQWMFSGIFRWLFMCKIWCVTFALIGMLLSQTCDKGMYMCLCIYIYIYTHIHIYI